ncbi:hypothetical protein JHK85_025844 [Glycine max]|nr:hypothetical protein JHK85_025844 [Glycine max]
MAALALALLLLAFSGTSTTSKGRVKGPATLREQPLLLHLTPALAVLVFTLLASGMYLYLIHPSSSFLLV